MKIVHVIAELKKEHGGTSAYVSELTNFQINEYGNGITILTGGEPDPNLNISKQCNFRSVTRESAYGLPSLYNRQFHYALKDIASKEGLDIIHCHGIWLKANHDTIHAAQVLKKPLILSVHGMLQPNALSISKAKKIIAMLAYQKKDLKKCDYFLASSRHEASAIRRLGLTQPIILSTPGIYLPKTSDKEFDRQKIKKAFVLCRLSPVKNLINLAKAWSIVANDDWELVISGPDDRGFKKILLQEVGKLNGNIKIIDAVYSAEKDEHFRSSSLFILPSLSENFGIVVAEALSYGIPVLTTRGTPWCELNERNCGWWIESDISSLSLKLKEILQMSEIDLHQMGLKGKVLVEQKYTWNVVVKNLQQVYGWILGKNEMPNNVLLQIQE